MAAPYWRSEDRWAARGLLVVVVALNLGIVYLNVLLNQWNNGFYNALQDKNYAVFVHNSSGLLARGFYIVVAVYQLYLNQMLQIRWRRWLTERYLQAWLAGGAYFRMQLAAGDTDNPDQRIADDLQLFVSGTLALAIGGLRAVVTLLSFVRSSGALRVGYDPVRRSSVILPGYMVWTALVYAIIGTWLTNRIGRPLVRLNFDQQRYEADFRFGLVRFRENAEGWRSTTARPTSCGAFASGSGRSCRTSGTSCAAEAADVVHGRLRQAAVIFPFIVAAPRYFRDVIHLGGLMQTATAFGQVQDSLSFIVSSYTTSRRGARWSSGSWLRAALEDVRSEAATAAASCSPTGRRASRARGRGADLRWPTADRGREPRFRRGTRLSCPDPRARARARSSAPSRNLAVRPGEIRVPRGARLLVLPRNRICRSAASGTW